MTWPTRRSIHQVTVTGGRVHIWTARYTPTGIRHDLTCDTPLAEVGLTEKNSAARRDEEKRDG